MSHTGYVVTRTDDQGRYRIEGLPIPPKGTRKWDRNGLSVRPGHLPYIENDHIPIPVGDGVDPVEFNVELRRAVTARGRITNELTGEPIMAALYYTPFRSNEHTDKYMRYADDLTTMLGNDTRYHSDEEGNFEIPVIPGRGVVTAKVSDSGDLVSGYGKAEIDEFKNNQGGLTPATRLTRSWPTGCEHPGSMSDARSRRYCGRNCSSRKPTSTHGSAIRFPSLSPR